MAATIGTQVAVRETTAETRKPNLLTATEALAAMAGRAYSAREWLASCQARIAAREPAVRAWALLRRLQSGAAGLVDAGAGAGRTSRRIIHADRSRCGGGPLRARLGFIFLGPAVLAGVNGRHSAHHEPDGDRIFLAQLRRDFPIPPGRYGVAAGNCLLGRWLGPVQIYFPVRLKWAVFWSYRCG